MTAEPGVRRAQTTWDGLAEPWRRSLELAWASFAAGNLGIGAVVTDGDGEIIATGRNRLIEGDRGDDHLAATSLAHAEMNALAKLRWGGDHAGATVWTTLEPCLQCAAAIRLADVGTVRFLSPDPLWADVARLPEVSARIAESWPAVTGPEPGPLGGFGLLLPMHVAAFWLPDRPLPPEWEQEAPGLAALARELAASAELIDLAAAGAGVAQVLERLWDRLDVATAHS